VRHYTHKKKKSDAVDILTAALDATGYHIGASKMLLSIATSSVWQSGTTDVLSKAMCVCHTHTHTHIHTH